MRPRFELLKILKIAFIKICLQMNLGEGDLKM